ncbi:hypothetical protein GCM10027596_09130 [Nocardioides korecus]
MRPLTRALATTALTGCLVLSSGCGGNPTPAPPPKTSPSPTASASSAPTPPALPAAAREKTKAGAVAFAKHYVSQLNYAALTGDVGELRALALGSCAGCQALTSGIAKVYVNGGSIRGGEWTVVGSKTYGFTQGHFFLDLAIRSSRQVVKESKTSTPRTFPGSRGQLRAFVLERRAGAWRVSELDPKA